MYVSKKERTMYSRESELVTDLCTGNTKQVFVYVTAEWPASGDNSTNEAIIWDQIITAPSADHLSNLAPSAKKKLVKSAAGKSIDPSRFVIPSPFSYTALLPQQQ